MNREGGVGPETHRRQVIEAHYCGERATDRPLAAGAEYLFSTYYERRRKLHTLVAQPTGARLIGSREGRGAVSRRLPRGTGQAGEPHDGSREERGGGRVRLRAYERPLLALALLFAGLLAILARADLGPLRPAGEQTEALRAPPCARTPPGTPPAGPTLRSYPRDRNVALAADRAGSFWLYGLPDPETGRPTDRSYDVLVACTNEGLPANQAALSVSGDTTERAGSGALARPTEKQRDGTLTTEYAHSGAITMEQRLSVEREVIVISYRVSNCSAAARRASLRSVLTPPERVPPPSPPAFVAPASYNAAERPFGSGSARNPYPLPRRSARSRCHAVAHHPTPAAARGAASGPEPDLLTLSPSGELLSGLFIFAPELARLPPRLLDGRLLARGEAGAGRGVDALRALRSFATAAGPPKGAL